jgi:hypothetical protein
VNIPGADLKSGLVLAEYVGAKFLKGGLHRFVILVFKQPHIIYQEFDFDNKARSSWSTRAFIEKHEFGQRPDAGNFFVVEKDSI